MQEAETLMETTASSAITMQEGPFNVIQEIVAAAMRDRAIQEITEAVVTMVGAVAVVYATIVIINLGVRKTGFCELFRSKRRQKTAG